MSSLFFKITRLLFWSRRERSSFLGRLLFRFRLFSLGYKASDIFVLATITKTGTHYIRFLLCYYAQLIEVRAKGGDINTVEHDDFLVDDMVPNSWHSSYMFMVPWSRPSPLLRHLRLKDFPRSHLHLMNHEWRGVRVLHTYRDLFDQAVVSYETKYRCRADHSSSSPKLIDRCNEDIAKNLTQLR